MLVCWTAVALLTLQKFTLDPDRVELLVATSRDGRAWDLASAPILKGALGPHLVDVGDGKWFLYYFDLKSQFKESPTGVCCATSDDGGKSWSEPKAISLKTDDKQGSILAPRVLRLDDGRFRLYFVASAGDKNPAVAVRMPPGVVVALFRCPKCTMTASTPGACCGAPMAAVELPNEKILSAVSKDGISFEAEKGVRLEHPGVTGLDVMVSADATWMFLPTYGENALARSTDGLTFKKEKRAFEWNGGAAVRDGDAAKLFSAESGIVVRSWDFKGDPKNEGTPIEAGKNEVLKSPTAIKRADGSYCLIYVRIK